MVISPAASDDLGYNEVQSNHIGIIRVLHARQPVRKQDDNTADSVPRDRLQATLLSFQVGISLFPTDVLGIVHFVELGDF